MKFSTKFNKVNHSVDTTGFTYTNLEALFVPKKPETAFQVDWIFIRNGKFGEQPIFIDIKNKQLVNVPKHMTEVCKNILNDPEAVEYLKGGNVAYKIRTYQTQGKDCFSIDFIDV